jgi:rRNA processing protein Krr1/Pno1
VEVEKCQVSSGEIVWIVNVRKGSERHIVKARHLILSMDVGLSIPNSLNILNQSSFKGTVLDIRKFKNSSP